MATFSGLRIHIRGLSSIVESKLTHTHLFNPKITPPIQAWVESCLGQEKKLLGIVDFHPQVFAVFPRLDHISAVIQWQNKYRSVDYLTMPTRNELPGGTKRPWPQKGQGRARHKTVNSPIWIRGGWTHGPRGPVTGYTVKPHFHLVNALKSILTVKMAQDDIKILDTLDSYEPESAQDLEKAIGDRGWGPSTLLVNRTGVFPEALMKAASEVPHVNLMPLVGLNTLSLAKHETLVITLEALKEVEAKILHQLVRVDLINTFNCNHYRQD